MTPRPKSRTVSCRRRRRVAGLVLAVGAILYPSGATAQNDSAYRFGIAVGGVSTVGLIVEREDPWGTIELTVGTWGFRDVSVSLVHKQYIGGGGVQGVVGAGVWGVLAFPPGERTGAALAVRFPLAVHWSFTPEHAVTAEVGFNRALAVRRTDPEDRLPLNKRIIPLPGFSYRWRTAS